ncbi:unnamed protein product [Ixodes pacificus]
MLRPVPLVLLLESQQFPLRHFILPEMDTGETLERGYVADGASFGHPASSASFLATITLRWLDCALEAGRNLPHQTACIVCATPTCVERCISFAVAASLPCSRTTGA